MFKMLHASFRSPGQAKVPSPLPQSFPSFSPAPHPHVIAVVFRTKREQLVVVVVLAAPRMLDAFFRQAIWKNLLAACHIPLYSSSGVGTTS